MLKHNKLRELLSSGKPTMGTRFAMASPMLTELIGSTGHYDYVEFMAEYAPFSQDDLENLVRAAELHNMASIIKIDFQNRGYMAQRAVASGFQGILFTDCRNAEEVRESIRLITPETPEDGGCFGNPVRRFIGFQPKVAQLANAERQRAIVKAFMIEKKSAMDDIEAICATPGVDIVQFGGSDYSLSRGWNAKDHEKERKEAEQTMIATALKHGVRPRCEIQTVEAARYYIDLGVKDFCLGDNLTYMLDIYGKNGEGLRSVIQTMK